MSHYARAIEILEEAWTLDTGVFWRLRQGIYSDEEMERVLNELRDVAVETGSSLPRRLVEVLWYVPLFMTWQRERVRELGGDVESYSRSVEAMTSEAERLLGVP